MKSVLVAHIADTHLGHRQYGIYEREVDIYDAFKDAIEKMLEEHVELVVHSGDFFDTYRPPVQAIRIAIRMLKMLKEKGVRVVAILGDHDLPKRRGDHPLAVLEELGLVHVIGIKRGQKLETSITLHTRSGTEVLIAGVHHHRRTSMEKLRSLLSSLGLQAQRAPSIPRILLLHQGLEGYSLEYEVTREDLPSGFSYYALGHVHRGSTFRIGEAIAAYPGSIEALRVDEVGYKHGFIVAEVGVDWSTTYFIEVVNRPQLVYTIEYRKLETELETIVSTAAKLAATGRKPIVHLRVVGEKIDRSRLYKLIQSRLERHVLHYRIQVQEERRIAPTVTGGMINEEKVDRLKLLETLLGDKLLAEYTDRLIDLVAEGAHDFEIHQLIYDLFAKKYGVSNGDNKEG